jgi:hypothetical protein
VQVRAGRATLVAHAADDFALRDVLAEFGQRTRNSGLTGRTMPAAPPRAAHWRGNVEAAMRRARLAVENAPEVLIRASGAGSQADTPSSHPIFAF